MIPKLTEGQDYTNRGGRPKLDAFVGKGGTFIMKVTSTNFNYSQKVATARAQEFVEFKKQQRASILGSSEASTQRDILTFEQRLERARNALEDFRKRNNISSEAEGGTRTQKQLDVLRKQLQSFAMMGVKKSSSPWSRLAVVFQSRSDRIDC
ncbi:MAG: hypothetical protein EXS36_12165 [Pedosphaera sp.]|nr:hypothetical protein [Pedosphaera sp.]